MERTYKMSSMNACELAFAKSAYEAELILNIGTGEWTVKVAIASFLRQVGIKFIP